MSGQFECVPCAKVFSKRSQLNRHHATLVHSGGPQLPCPHTKKYSRSDNLRAHIRARHPDVHNPNHIGRASQNKPTRKPEILGASDSNVKTAKPFCCAVCSARFQLHNTLMSHLRRHSGENTFKCFQCPMAFIQGAAVKIHLQKIHGVELGGMALRKRSGFQCIVCGLRMRDRNQLDEHLNSHMIQAPPELSKEPQDFVQTWKEPLEIEYPVMEVGNDRVTGFGVSILKTEQISLSPEKREEVAAGSPEVIQLDDDEDAEENDGSFDIEDVGFFSKPPAILEIFDDGNEDDEEEEPKPVIKEEVVPSPSSTWHTTPASCGQCGRVFGNLGALGFHLKMKHARKSCGRKMRK